MGQVYEIQAREFRALTQSLNLRQGMFSVLEFIASNPGISQGHIGEVIGIDKSTRVAILNELGQRSWVQRRRNPKDRRKYQLSITPNGRKILELLIANLTQVENVGRTVLSTGEFAAVASGLNKIYAAYRRVSRVRATAL